VCVLSPVCCRVVRWWWLQLAVDPMPLLHAPHTARLLCKHASLPCRICRLHLYHTHLIAPEQNLQLSAPICTCSGRCDRSVESCLCTATPNPCGTEVANATFVSRCSLDRNPTNTSLLTRRCRASELSSPHCTVASVFILASALPVTACIIVCRPRSSLDLACAKDWRNAWDSCRLATSSPLLQPMSSALGNRSYREDSAAAAISIFSSLGSLCSVF
jgi:hypothetical protein